MRSGCRLVLPAPHPHPAVLRVHRGDDGSGEAASQLSGQLGVLEQSRSQHHPPQTRGQGGLHLLGSPIPTAALHRNVHRLGNPAYDLELLGFSQLSSIQIHHVQSLGALRRKRAGHENGIFTVDRRVVELALAQAHTAASLQIDSGIELHQNSPQKSGGDLNLCLAVSEQNVIWPQAGCDFARETNL